MYILYVYIYFQVVFLLNIKNYYRSLNDKFIVYRFQYIVILHTFILRNGLDNIIINKSTIQIKLTQTDDERSSTIPME